MRRGQGLADQSAAGEDCWEPPPPAPPPPPHPNPAAHAILRARTADPESDSLDGCSHVSDNVEECLSAMPMLGRDLTVNKRGYRLALSLWVALALGALLVSNALYFVAFLTNGWGVVTVKEDTGDVVWDFGLWQCCRRGDGLCLGPGWPRYYGAARAFAVLGLFGHVLSFGWLIGHTLERLLEYDPCALAAMAAINFTSAVFVLISVCCFGAIWPEDFSEGFQGWVSEARLQYSFGLACVAVALLMLTGVFTVLEIRSSLANLTRKPYRVDRAHRESDQNRDKIREVFYPNQEYAQDPSSQRDTAGTTGEGKTKRVSLLL